MIKSHGMNLSDAWSCLGYDPNLMHQRLILLPRESRINEARSMLEDAKKKSKILMRDHHPDRGGDPSKFLQISQAISVIESHTQDFEVKMKAFIREMEQQASKKVFIFKE